MTVSWGLVADLGIIFKLAKFIPHNIILHVMCFIFVIATSVYEVVRMNKSYDLV